MKLSDEEAITMAMLLGCEFYEPTPNEVYVDDVIDERYRHSLEREK